MLKYEIMKGKNLKEDNMIKNSHCERSSRVDFSLPEKLDCRLAGRHKTAFTLAEVLITLGIIGVVAAMTLPALIGKYQKLRNATQLKVTYSIISQAFKQAEADYGDSKFWFSDMYGKTSGSEAYLNELADKYFLPYVKVAKDFGYQSLNNIKYGNLYYLNKTKFTNAPYTMSRIVILSNGTLVQFTITGNCIIGSDGHCASDWWYGGFRVYIDINGIKKPNTLGKDVFVLNYQLYNTNDSSYAKLLLYGAGNSEDGLKENCSLNGSGISCGALIQHDNWKINYDW